MTTPASIAQSTTSRPDPTGTAAAEPSTKLQLSTRSEVSPPEPPVQESGPQQIRLDRPTRGVAIGLLVVFVLAIFVMVLLRADTQWDRLVYLYSGLEAIVFASAGALFGTTVQRGAVVAAQGQARQARDEAAQAHQRARQREQTAARGEALAATAKAAAAEPAGAPGGVRRGARPGDQQVSGGVGTTDPALVALARVATALFPD